MDDTSANPRSGSDSAAWAVIAAIILALAGLQWRSPIQIEIAGLANVALASAALSGAAIFYRFVRPRENFSVMCVALMQVLLFSVVGAILSYLIAREGGALWDESFAAWDRALGFDWLTYVRWVDGHAWIVTPLHLAYGSLIPQMIVVVLALGFTGRLSQLRAVMLAAIVSGTITVILSPLFPAVSNFVYLGLTAEDFRHINPWAGYLHVAHFTALRDGSLAILRIQEMQGIITFPSYHAALTIVTFWGFWRSGIGWIRYCGSAVALATIVATPVDGGHYLVDVLAGTAVALISIGIARRAIFYKPSYRWVMAWPFRHSRAASAQ